jgi:tRNA(fMet)-specific endonuclease VapC
MWLPDTNVWIAYFRKAPSPVKARIANLPEDQVLLCDVIKGELYYGAYKSIRIAENLARLDTLFSVVQSLPFNGEAAQRFGELRAYLFSQGTPIGPYDLQIAAIALAFNLTVVTHNTREFSRVPGLKLEDWEVQ